MVGVGFDDALMGMASFGVVVAVAIGIGVHVGIGVGEGVIVVTVDVERGLHAAAQVMTTSAIVAATFLVTRNKVCFTRLNVRLL